MLAGTVGAGAGAILAACGGVQEGVGQVKPLSGPPKKITLVKTSGGDQDAGWKAQFAQASNATNVTVEIEIDADSANYYSKRIAEFAAGTMNFDLMGNAANQVRPLGLKGILANLNPMWRRDK